MPLELVGSLQNVDEFGAVWYISPTTWEATLNGPFHGDRRQQCCSGYVVWDIDGKDCTWEVLGGNTLLQPCMSHCGKGPILSVLEIGVRMNSREMGVLLCWRKFQISITFSNAVALLLLGAFI